MPDAIATSPRHLPMISAVRPGSRKRSGHLFVKPAAMIVQSERLQSSILRGELVNSEQLTRLRKTLWRASSRG